MLFNSPVFMFVFLPAALAVFLLLRRFWLVRAAQAALVLASFVFYAWWNPKYLLLLLLSIVVNLAMARVIGTLRAGDDAGAGRRRAVAALQRHRVQSRPARLFQIRQLLPRYADSAGGIRIWPHQRSAAAGHFLLHLPAGRLSGRYLPGKDPGSRSGPLCTVRHLLPAADRRTDRPPFGNDAAVPRGGAAWPRPVVRLPARPVHIRHRPVQEGADRRHDRAVLLARLFAGAERRAAGFLRRLAGRARLHGADLFRLLRLLRHGDGCCSHVRHQAPGQFLLALQVAVHHRVLAALAHHAVAVPARLSLHTAGRKPPWQGAPLLQPDDDHAAGRPCGTGPAGPSCSGVSCMAPTW